jgi:hypothetical protein
MSREPAGWKACPTVAVIAACLVFRASIAIGGDSTATHQAEGGYKPMPWPDGIIPYDVSHLSAPQQTTVFRAMQRWIDTGARIAFVPRTAETEYVNFTGKTDAGNNTSWTGFKRGSASNINITAFWWNQGEWMPAHELGHVLGFHHEHARWDRDAYVTIHYENIKPGRSGDYDAIARTNWLVSSTPYDYYSIMHYRICWASSCESQCKDGIGSSPCAVIVPVDTKYDRIIGQWDKNRISAGDAEKARQAYGSGRTVYVRPDNTEEGEGTLEKSFQDLARARQQCAHDSRLILLSSEGTWSFIPR